MAVPIFMTDGPIQAVCRSESLLYLFGLLSSPGDHRAEPTAGGDGQRRNVRPSLRVKSPRVRRLTETVAEWLRSRDRLVIVAALMGVLYLVAFLAGTLLFPKDGLPAQVLVDVVYPLPEALATILLFLAARRTLRVRWFWYLLSLGMFVGLLGDVNWAVYDLLLGVPPTPSVGDVAYAVQPLIMIGAFVAAFRVARPSLGDFVDISIPFAAAFFGVFEFVIDPQLADGLSAATIPSVIETLAMVALALVATAIMINHRGVPREVVVMYLGTITAAISYPIYSYAISVSSWSNINWTYCGFQVWFLAVGLGSLIRIRCGEPASPPRHVGTTANAWLITGGLALVLAVIAVRTQNGRLDPHAPYVAIVAIGLVVMRMHQIVRRQADLATELALALDEQQRLAETDALTGAPNRRAFDAMLEAAVQRACLAGGAMGIVILDFDEFKRVNDGFGHPAGDEVLRTAAMRLRGAARHHDEFARIGGEEFAVVVSDVNEAELHSVAQRCCEAVASGPYRVCGQDITLTTSAGTAHFPTDGRSAESLIRIADRALYQAKRDGGNRVHAGARHVHVTTLPVPDNTALSFLERLADQLDREQAEQEHSRAMMDISSQLCDRLDMSTDQRRRCLMAARLHDVGKVGVPAQILAKPGKLSDAEWSVMREHVRIGVDLLRRCPETADIAEVVAQHHERPDGTGYPNALHGDETCLEAKVIAATDAWTAMLADRPYRSARTTADARKVIIEGRGSQFDPRVADALIELVDGAQVEAA
jgi:two-component system, cell cycle response regulator